MANCTVTYSIEVARRAVRTYFWRRFKTPLGLGFLFFIPLMAGLICFVYLTEGDNWIVGAIGLLIALNILIQGTVYLSFQKLFPADYLTLCFERQNLRRHRTEFGSLWEAIQRYFYGKDSNTFGSIKTLLS